MTVDNHASSVEHADLYGKVEDGHSIA
jgi:hypothetical protein